MLGNFKSTEHHEELEVSGGDQKLQFLVPCVNTDPFSL